MEVGLIADGVMADLLREVVSEIQVIRHVTKLTSGQDEEATSHTALQHLY